MKFALLMDPCTIIVCTLFRLEIQEKLPKRTMTQKSPPADDNPSHDNTLPALFP
ncbi:hypothetical protein [Pseudodesulfovibrio tunisiensis]|uniref:hypothetical protein n=1 Tax=Pseudodesulfovibrio tunisiensis TaxID=463192 RepID=UPI001FB2368E|nr:hypothetical protein [Pseudodesulfovibrio tunisiensis]